MVQELSPEAEYELGRAAHREKALLTAWNYDEGEDPYADYIRLRLVDTVAVRPEYL